MIKNIYGNIAEECLHEIPNHYQDISINSLIVMPNHIHMILTIQKEVGAQYLVPTKKEIQKNTFQHIVSGSIGSIIRGYKIGVTKWFRKNTEIYTVWQKNYHEHIIRTDKDYFKIYEY